MKADRVQFDMYVMPPGSQNRTESLDAKHFDEIELAEFGVIVRKGGLATLYPWSRVRQVTLARDDAKPVRGRPFQKAAEKAAAP